MIKTAVADPGRKALLAGLTVHDLRDTAASYMFEAGATVKHVQAALGHTRPDITLMLYSGFTGAMEDTTTANLDAAFHATPKVEAVEEVAEVREIRSA